MKKKRWLAVVALAACALMGFAACKPDEEPGGPEGPGGPGDFVGSKDDEYVDYDPTKQPGGDQFDHDGNYLPPELVIDGKDDDEQWQNAPVLLTYGGADGAAVSVKAWRGERAMFFYFDVQDSILLTQGLTNGDEVCRGDSVEIYIDTKADGGRYPQSDDFQFNFGIHGKARIMQGAGSQWGLWNGLIDYEVSINEGSTLNNGAAANDTGYSMEVMVQYKEIMIEKDDTVGIAFGHVDKVQVEDGRDGQYYWYGWNYKGAEVNVQRPETYIFFDKDGNLMSRDELPMPAVDVAGNVKDQDGNAVAGATVTMTADGEEDEPQTTTTNADGYFVFAKTDPEKSYAITVTKDNYIAATGSYTRAELRAANGEPVVKDITLTSTVGLAFTTLTGTVKNIVYGAVEGATVTVKNTTIKTITGADGAFSLANVPASIGDVTVVISKTGYDDTELTVSSLTADGATALNDINFNLPVTRGLVVAAAGDKGTNTGHFVSAEVTVARTLNGIEFKFNGERKLHSDGQIEVYINKGKTSANVKENLPDGPLWQFNLYADGRITASRASTSTAGLQYTVHSNTDSYKATLLVPYSYLGIQNYPLECIGFAIGEWIGGSIKQWDPMTLNGGAAIQPDHTTDYLRLDAKNRIYSASHNDTVGTLSGNVGIAGVTVSAGGKSTVSGTDGAWSIELPITWTGTPASSAEITVNYTKTGYKPRTSTVLAGHFTVDVLAWEDETVTSLTQHLVTVTGTVTDQNGNAVAGATVEIRGEGVDRTMTTGSDGTYTIEDITTLVGVKVTFSKNGYATGVEEITAKQLAETEGSFTLNRQITNLTSLKTATLKGKVVGLSGNLAGVTVTAGDTFTSITEATLTATTGEDGTFEIADFPLVDGTVTLTLDGYRTHTFNLRGAEMTETEHSLGSVFLAREYEALGSAFGTKSDSFAGFVPYVTRGETGFEFKFVGSKAFTGNIEMFVDTKQSKGEGGRDATDYRFNLYADGSVTVKNWQGGTETEVASAALAAARIAGTASTPEVTFTLPYAFIGVTSTEIVGVSFGQAITGEWDGWTLSEDFAKLKGVNGSMHVRPEMTWDYVRIGVDNKPYWSVENDIRITSDYNLHFGRLNDSIHAKVTRDETGVTFEFVTLGTLGTSMNPNANAVQNELILIYIDKGEPAAATWGNDYQYKIAPDGSVRGKASAWWGFGTGDAKANAEITTDNGLTTIKFKMLYTDVGITKDEVFGFALVEGWQTGDNWSNEYGGMIYDDGTVHHVMNDAARENTFIRMKADGTLVSAASNSAVS